VTEHDYLAVASNAVSLEAWQVVVTKALKQAQRGDHKAREWLSGYLMPKPSNALPLSRMLAAETLEVDLADSDLVDIYHQVMAAHSTAQTILNFQAARAAGVKVNSMTQALRVGLFGVNGATNGDGDT
jgi:hypothetical protein